MDDGDCEVVSTQILFVTIPATVVTTVPVRGPDADEVSMEEVEKDGKRGGLECLVFVVSSRAWMFIELSLVSQVSETFGRFLDVQFLEAFGRPCGMCVIRAASFWVSPLMFCCLVVWVFALVCLDICVRQVTSFWVIPAIL